MTAVEGSRGAQARLPRHTNTRSSTARHARMRQFFDEMMDLGVEAYPRPLLQLCQGPDRSISCAGQDAPALRDMLSSRRALKFNQSPLFLRFLMAARLHARVGQSDLQHLAGSGRALSRRVRVELPGAHEATPWRTMEEERHEKCGTACALRIRGDRRDHTSSR